MTALPDVNVLIALAWPNHVHHAAARRWFEACGRDGWATCPLTEAGFVRVSCNPSVVRHTVTPLDAIGVLERLTRLESHIFWPLDQSSTCRRRSDAHPGLSPDFGAVLLAAAMQRNGQLATLDGGLKGLVAERDRSFLHVIPV